MVTALTRKEPARHTEVASLPERCFASRELSTDLAAPLSEEDQCVQSMPDASPTKWHLAHTTWFYETFVLKPHLPGFSVYDEAYHYCFNSYYEAEGPRHPRPQRGLLTRPSLGDIRRYREHVDEALARLFALERAKVELEVAALIELGINHEQQHQELLLTDILSLFASQPLYPAYGTCPPARDPSATRGKSGSTAYEGGIVEIGQQGAGFHFDCEGPRHEALLRPYRLANALVTNADWLEFMSDGGYSRPGLWLADGWSTVKAEGWQAPGYWQMKDGAWHHMSLHGLVPVDPAAPVCHISYYEADAFASFANRRLPTEMEWENAARHLAPEGNMLGSGRLCPVPLKEAGGSGPTQMFGDVWEWTRSSYSPYPGFEVPKGAVGEYNGKFMCGQFVLRGSSCVTPDGHTRATYRNFFYPHQRWQFMGLRLAEDML